MDCAECVSHVQRAIQSVPGVEDVQVFLGVEKAKISYHETPPDQLHVENAVKRAGYEAIYFENLIPEESELSERSSVSNLLILLGLVIGIVLFVTVIGEWLGLFDAFTDFIPWYVWLTAILIGGWPIFRNVLQSALKGQVISHSLMTLGVLAAVLVGEWPTAAVVVLFMRVGDFVEGFTTGKARSAVKDLTRLSPRNANVEKDGKETSLPVDQVALGETVVIRPGETVPVDGEVISGSAAVDQSAISGESMPVDAVMNSKVFAASILLTGMLKVQVTAVGVDSAFGKVIRLVEEVEANRSDVQRVADKFAGIYLPVVAGIALLTLIVRRDPLAAAATLVVACSCSFALATPIAMLASIGSAARQGLLIKGGKYIENLERIDTLFVDKTGTLTIGKPRVTDIIPLGEYGRQELLTAAASTEKYSEHPLGKAVLRLAEEEGVLLEEATDFNSMPGKGVRASVGKDLISIINKPLHNDADIKTKTKVLADQGKSLFYIHVNNQPAGIIAAADEPRPEVREAINQIRDYGIKNIFLLSGDHEAAVRNLASELGIDYRAGLLPEEKIMLIRDAQLKGQRVAMVGDGINDAPALAQADVGIAMGATGSDIAIEAAHVALLREDWLLVPYLFEIAKRTMSVVKLNILFTAIYNLAGLTLAAFGILPPVLAAALQSLPDVGILANSARLIKTK